MAVVVLGLAGCQQGGIESVTEEQGNQGDQSEQSQGDGEQVEINLWHFDPGARQEVYQEAIARFEEKNPNVTV
ncbi:hypothetical protein KH400_23805, partial [Desertibacillus haloalkaliphilus]|nr:hypothetical protein [Desertibacillus haloalkaliphilus]